jgi:hypothetical protein
MQEQWRGRPAKRHPDMNMNTKFDRTGSDAAKSNLVTEMKKDPKPGWRLWRCFY